MAERVDAIPPERKAKSSQAAKVGGEEETGQLGLGIAWRDERQGSGGKMAKRLGFSEGWRKTGGAFLVSRTISS